MNPRSSRRTMRAVVLGVAIASALFPAVWCAQEKTITGEVLDLACYLTQGAKGPDHASCAKACAKGGQPMGLLGSDGKVYVLVASHDNGKPYDAAKDLAGTKVEVKGNVSKQGSLEAIEVLSITAK